MRLAHYAKCWECGAEAGIDCIDEDGRPAVEVCDGRRLLVNDSASKLAKTRDRRRPQRNRTPTVPTPCDVCGCATVRGRKYCDKAACQDERWRRNASRARQGLEEAHQQGPGECRVCRGPMPPTRRPDRLYCSRECAIFVWRQRNRERVAATRAAAYTPPQHPPCPVCGEPSPARDHRPRLYCGRTCRSTAKSRRQRSQITADPAS